MRKALIALLLVLSPALAQSRDLPHLSDHTPPWAPAAVDLQPDHRVTVHSGSRCPGHAQPVRPLELAADGTWEMPGCSFRATGC